MRIHCQETHPKRIAKTSSQVEMIPKRNLEYWEWRKSKINIDNSSLLEFFKIHTTAKSKNYKNVWYGKLYMCLIILRSITKNTQKIHSQRYNV